uniref:Uncharacterized protein n=1 Tax=African swine fever virus TaxID=10497 RepID=A0A7G2FKC4_ASF|nr:phypothetical protein [African swine fever virus]
MARHFHVLYLSNIQQSILMMSFRGPTSQVYDSLQLVSRVHYPRQMISQIYRSYQLVSLLKNNHV